MDNSNLSGAMRSLLIFAMLLLSAWADLAAIPIRVRTEAISAEHAIGQAVTVHLNPQSASGSSEPRVVQIGLPGEQMVDLPAGTWQVLIEGKDLWSPPVLIALTADQPEQLVTLRLFPAAQISGRLAIVFKDQAPGALDLRIEPSPGPAAGPKIPAASFSCPLRDGSFQCMVPLGRFDLRLRAASFVPVYLWDIPVQQGRSPDLGLLTLQKGASVTGWVRTSEGQGISDAKIRLEPQTLGTPREPTEAEALRAMAMETRTNGRGFFQLIGPVPGVFVVAAEKDGLARDRRFGIEVRPDLEAQILEPLILAKPVALRLVLDPPISPSGSQWNVFLEKKPEIAEIPTPGERGTHGEAAAEGVWEQKGLSPGTYWVDVRDGDTPWQGTEVELLQEQTELHLALQGLRLRGRISLGDEPLPAVLSFQASSPPKQARFRSDEEGRFEGLLPQEGTWNVEVVSAGERLQVRLDPVEIRKAPGQSYARVDLRVPDTRLKGLVVDEQEQAVPEAELLFMVPRKRPSRATSDNEGTFEVRGLPPGTLLVRAEAEDRESEWLEIRVEEDVDTPDLKLVLRSKLRVAGRVFSSQGPVAGAQITATAPMTSSAAASGDTAVSGPAGAFTVELPGGSQGVHLSVLAPGYATRMLFAPLGPERTVEIPLEPVGGTLVFDLGGLTPDEIRRAGAGILAHGGSFVPFMTAFRWAAFQRSAQTDPRRLVVPNMEAGNYLLCVGPESYLTIPKGLTPPDHQCSRGTLAPLQELVLAVPAPADASR